MHEIARLWAELIQNGIKTIEQVPKRLIEEVQNILSEAETK